MISLKQSNIFHEKQTSFYVKVVGFFYIVLICMLLLGQKLNFFDLNQNDNLVIIKESVRVDIISMPKLTVQELKEVDVKDQPATESTESAEDSTSVNLNNLLSNFSKKKIIKKKQIKKKRNNKQIRKLVLEGNKVVEGQVAVGDSFAYNKTEYSQYLSRIPSIIRPFWKLPSYLLEKDLGCRIKIFINKDGYITSKKLIKSSGNSEYDQYALKALADTNRLPIPDKSIISKVTLTGLVLGFPL